MSAQSQVAGRAATRDDSPGVPAGSRQGTLTTPKHRGRRPAIRRFTIRVDHARSQPSERSRRAPLDNASGRLLPQFGRVVCCTLRSWARPRRAQGVLMKLSVLMPVYNEAATVLTSLKRTLDVPFPCEFEVVVVDDGSTDGTSDLLARLDHPAVVIHRHRGNKGKGAAVRTAAGLAT